MPAPVLAALDLSEGVELSYALIARIADDVGARALAIKGRVNEAHRLRRPRASADADVLVEPGGLDRIVDALMDVGWRKVPTPTVPPAFGYHSVTLDHPQWPCELDLHDRFPGFLADPAEVFDVLWTERTFVTAASVAIPATGLYGSALVMALHALRTPSDQRNGLELAGLVERLESRKIDPHRLLTLAEATGSVATARPFLESLGLRLSPIDEHDSGWQQWELRRSVGQTRNVGWLVALRRTPPWRWPELAVTVLLSTEPMLRRYYPEAPPGARGLWLARWWRLKRGIRDLPQAVRAARRLSAIGR